MRAAPPAVDSVLRGMVGAAGENFSAEWGERKGALQIGLCAAGAVRPEWRTHKSVDQRLWCERKAIEQAEEAPISHKRRLALHRSE
jgi:hypothetical protein